jgi:uncharacterized protein YyaL (SSP411 family)
MAHTNRLIHESSPYLLQHAHNPVDWYPWGAEALEKARLENKPILVSIGYSACHWCHVMEKESFEDEATAELMNRYFVNIKIDREERPDLDHIYMDAVQAMTGSGGWPLNVFLTPDTRPFFGGTYFPPVRAYQRSSWKEVLEAVHQTFTQKRDEIEAQAAGLTDHLINAASFGLQPQALPDTFFTNETLQQIAANLLSTADTTWGGFGNAPKFPQTFLIQYLLRHYHFTRDEAALRQALLSLDKMIQGGIYDQAGGGFARYSTDKKWLAPHFEKMLYDNALLVQVLAEAYQLTRFERYATVIRQTLRFVERELMSPHNGFYSALDADSEGVEGKYYTWQKQEIDELLGADAPLFCELYNVSEEGNWEETNILWLPETPEAFAARKGMDIAVLQEKIAGWQHTLLLQREKRVRPQLDNKILLGWNALMNTAFSKAYAALGETRYRQVAQENMLFLQSHFKQGDGWLHTLKKEGAAIGAFLDDYAFLVQALIALQEITGDTGYLRQAAEITGYVQQHFREEGSGYFYFTPSSQHDVVVRKKEVYDGATPSGNATMACNLYYLSIVFNNADWAGQASRMIASLGQAIVRYPSSFGVWALLAQLITEGMNEIAVVGAAAADTAAEVLGHYIPNKIIQFAPDENPSFPLLAGKKAGSEAVQIYLCKNYACQAPVTGTGALMAQLERKRP